MKKSNLPQDVIFYNNVFFSPQSVVIPMNYPTTNCNILLQNIVDYHKKIIFLLQHVIFYHNVLHLTQNVVIHG